jgi:hypothetical protein
MKKVSEGNMKDTSYHLESLGGFNYFFMSVRLSDTYRSARVPNNLCSSDLIGEFHLSSRPFSMRTFTLWL